MSLVNARLFRSRRVAKRNGGGDGDVSASAADADSIAIAAGIESTHCTLDGKGIARGYVDAGIIITETLLCVAAVKDDIFN